MTKNEYLESNRGLPYSQIIAEQPQDTIVGSIRGDNLRNVVDILAKGLQFRLDNAEPSPLRTALLTVFKYLLLPDYAINLSLPENIGLLEKAVNVGLVEPTERDQFIALASYTKPRFNLSIADCVDYFGTGGPLEAICVSGGNRYRLDITNDMPEPQFVRIEYSLKIEDLQGPWILAAQVYVPNKGAHAGFCGFVPAGATIRAQGTYPIEGQVRVM